MPGQAWREDSQTAPRQKIAKRTDVLGVPVNP